MNILYFSIFLKVRDGPEETAPLVAKHCGHQLPPAFTSTSNDLWMKLKSDSTQSGSGFRATYTVACGGTYTGRSAIYIYSAESVGDTNHGTRASFCVLLYYGFPLLLVNKMFKFFIGFSAESGSLISPYYPSRYPDNKDCFYVIRQEPGHVITLSFVDFSIEHSLTCEYDYIEVRNSQ